MDAAGILLVAPTGRVLLLRRSDDGTWALPGGHIERSDANPLYAAIRELREETGFGGQLDAELAVLDRAMRPADGLVYWTFGAYVGREFPPRLNAEHTEAAWCRPAAPPRPLHPGVERLFRRLGLTRQIMASVGGRGVP